MTDDKISDNSQRVALNESARPITTAETEVSTNSARPVTMSGAEGASVRPATTGEGGGTKPPKPTR